MGKYMNPWENRIILERGNWGISLMGKRFPYVKTLNPLYGNRQSAGKVLGMQMSANEFSYGNTGRRHFLAPQARKF